VRHTVLLAAGGLLLAGMLGLGALLWTKDGEESAAAAPQVTTKREPALERVRGLAARVPAGRRVVLRAKPEGRVLATVLARTEFGSPQTLVVVFRKGPWIAVRSPELGNRRVGWVRAGSLALVGRPLRLEVDLSRRELIVRVDRGISRRIGVAIGAAETPTPTGRFYVTDKLAGADFGSSYGCCILALSGRQPRLPQGWSGGDRLAIHGSPAPTWGTAASNGCLHADEADLRYLMRVVRLGTDVRIHA